MAHNYLAQDTEIKLINSLAPYLVNRNFIDVGAEKGEFALTMFEQGLCGILFEPMSRHHAELQQLVSRYADSKMYICAISNVDAKQKFYVATDSDGKELDYYHSLQKGDTPGIFEHSNFFEVECRSLLSLAEHGEIFSDIGILKIDTEGNDLNVLRGMGSLRPEIIICEYFTQGLYAGWPEGGPESIITYMHGLGYHDFLATKRVGRLEFVGLGTAAYQEKQWGNLFFFREDYYAKVQLEIAECILRNEKELQNKFELLVAALEQKEQIIQQLLLETQQMSEMPAEKLPPRQGWVARLLALTHRHN